MPSSHTRTTAKCDYILCDWNAYACHQWLESHQICTNANKHLQVQITSCLVCDKKTPLHGLFFCCCCIISTIIITSSSLCSISPSPSAVGDVKRLSTALARYPFSCCCWFFFSSYSWHDTPRQSRSANQKKSFPSIKHSPGRRSALIPSLSVCPQHILTLKSLLSVLEKLNEVDCPELLQLIRYDNEIPLLIIRRMDSSRSTKKRRRFVLELTWTQENIYLYGHNNNCVLQLTPLNLCLSLLLSLIDMSFDMSSWPYSSAFHHQRGDK